MCPHLYLSGSPAARSMSGGKPSVPALFHSDLRVVLFYQGTCSQACLVYNKRLASRILLPAGQKQKERRKRRTLASFLLIPGRRSSRQRRPLAVSRRGKKTLRQKAVKIRMHSSLLPRLHLSPTPDFHAAMFLVHTHRQRNINVDT